MKKLFTVVIALMALGFSTNALAACTLPASSASFGTVTSFTLGTTLSNTSTTANVNCGGGLMLGLLSSNNITLRLASASNTVAAATGNRGTMKRVGDASSDNIPVMLCSASNCASEMTTATTAVNYPSSSLLNLGLNNTYNFALPLYLRTVIPSQPVAAGTYTVTLNVAVVYRICTGIAVGGLLCLSDQNQNGSGSIPITVTMIVTNDCTTITAPNVSFGSAPLVSSFNTVSQSISVICTKGSTYTIGISNGNNAVNNVRNMANGAALLSYDIYKGSSTTDRWGPTGTQRQASTNASTTSSDGVTRTFTYTAKILTTQNTPAAGNYSDNVVVDLSF